MKRLRLWRSMVTEQSDFLELLANPQRVRIKTIIKNLFANIRCYAWDTMIDTWTTEINGTHILKITCKSPNYFVQVDEMFDKYFPPSGDYWVNIGQRNAHESYSSPDGDKIYTKRYQVIER